MWLVQYIPTETKFAFMRLRRMTFPLSAVLSILSVVLFFAWGMNFGIDFRGGTLIEMQSRSGPANIASIRQQANALPLGEVEVQEFGSPQDISLRVQLQPGGEEAQQKAVNLLRDTFAGQYEIRRIEVVGPRVSGELVQSGILGVVFAIVGVLIYLWFRFEWQFAMGAVIATLHDIVLTVGFFALTQIEFNMTSIAAILTIIGYSLNDTVVVYDRIREIMRKYKRMSTFDMLDLSVNSTLSRTVITGISTFLALVALAIFGGEIIKSFAYAMLFGLIIGTYSSIFVAAPILVYLGLKPSGETASAAVGGEVPQPAE